jgi:hypothetical protein
MRFSSASSSFAAGFVVLTSLPSIVFAQSNTTTGLSVKLSVASKVLNGSTDGHVTVLFAPAGVDPLNDTDVTSSPNVSHDLGQNAPRTSVLRRPSSLRRV